MNLVLNARDAMPDGGTLSVRTRLAEVDEAFARRHPAVPPGSYTTLEVQDTGSGMDPETLAQMFEPFYTTKPVGKGLGLGLSTIHSSTRQSGGYILTYSELGVGTTFSLYFPRLESQAPDAAADAASSVTETILLVEDDATIRHLAKRFLAQRGYTVLDASDGPDALRISRRHPGPIDLLLTDVVMPNMSGREVAFQLSTERTGMKVLYLSGHTVDTISHHGVLADGMSFIQKPFTRAALLAKVRGVLDAK